MTSACTILIGLWLGSSAFFAPGGATDGSAALSDKETAGALEALDLFQADRFADAATRFEELEREFGDPRYLFNAGVARERLGQDAYAYMLFRRALASTKLSADERDATLRRVKELMSRSVRLRVSVGAGTSGTTRVILSRDDSAPVLLDPGLLAVAESRDSLEVYVEAGSWLVEASAPGYAKAESRIIVDSPAPIAVSLELEALRTPLRLEVVPEEAVRAGFRVQVRGPGGETVDEELFLSSAEWTLPMGSYEVEVSAEGYETVVHEVNLDPDGSPLRVLLKAAEPPVGTPALPGREKNKLALGLGVTSVASLIAGSIVLGVATADGKYGVKRDGYLSLRGDPTDAPEAKRRALHWSIHGTNTGASLIGISAGSAIGALTTLIPDQRKTAIAEVATGSFAVILGAAGFGVAHAAFFDDSRSDAWYSEKSDRHERCVDDAAGAACPAGPGEGEFASTEGSLDKFRTREAVYTSVLGLGLAISGSGVAKMLLSRSRATSRRSQSKVSVTPIIGGGATATITGRF